MPPQRQVHQTPSHKPKRWAWILVSVDFVLFSGLWPAAIAASLVALMNQGLGLPRPTHRLLWGAMGLAAAGTLAIYSLDRIRDLHRDRIAAPLRTAFVVRHQQGMIGLCILAIVASGPLASTQPQASWALCGFALILGLFHRRIKSRPLMSLLCVTTAWVAIVLGLPAAHRNLENLDEKTLLSLGFTLALVIAGNLVGSELREIKGASAEHSSLRTAQIWATGGLIASILLPGAQLCFPLALLTLLALLFFRPNERYGLGVLDGALLVGALLGLGLGLGLEKALSP